jgi:uroporphyrinogen-III synthase
MSAVLITRPQPDADALAADLIEKNFSVLVDPLFTLEFSAVPPKKQNYQALLATSRNAIRALVKCKAAKDFLELLLLVVGEETEAEARRAGFSNIKSAGGSAASLGRLVLENCAPLKEGLLYLAGKTRKSVLEEELKARGFMIEVWEAYAMHASTALRDETLSALRQKTVDTVLLFSEHASMQFLQLTKSLGGDALKTPTYFCLSGQVAMPLRQKGLNALYPSTPTLQALIELLMQKNH